MAVRYTSPDLNTELSHDKYYEALELLKKDISKLHNPNDNQLRERAMACARQVFEWPIMCLTELLRDDIIKEEEYVSRREF